MHSLFSNLLTLLLQDRLINLTLLIKRPIYAHLCFRQTVSLPFCSYTDFTLLSLSTEGPTREGGFQSQHIVLQNNKILSLIMGMCYIISVNKGASHCTSNPFLTILSQHHKCFSVQEVYTRNTKQYRLPLEKVENPILKSSL